MRLRRERAKCELGRAAVVLKEAAARLKRRVVVLSVLVVLVKEEPRRACRLKASERVVIKRQVCVGGLERGRSGWTVGRPGKARAAAGWRRVYAVVLRVNTSL